MASPVFKTGEEFKSNGSYDLNGQTVTQYGSGAAGTFDQDSRLQTRPGAMTYQGTISKTSLMLVLAVIVAVPGYMFPNDLLFFASAGIAFVLSLVLCFKKVTTPALALAYAVFEGYFLGALTIYIETSFDVPGAGLQALLATFITAGVCLALYRSGAVRYTNKMRKVLLIGGITYMIFCLANVGFMIFGNPETAFGLRTEYTIMGIPLGVLIGVVAILLACISLISDFDFIDNGVRSGVDEKVEWKAAFGLMLTLVWLYIEFLRIIAIVMGRR